MEILEMSEAECLRKLGQTKFGRLACARDNQPYVVPVYFAFDGRHIYGITTLGQKVEWMRLNPQVCLEIDERSSDDTWLSVVVFGRYEELPDEPRFGTARTIAHQLLQQRSAIWWEPATSSKRNKSLALTPIVYRIHIRQITGYRTSPNEE